MSQSRPGQRLHSQSESHRIPRTHKRLTRPAVLSTEPRCHVWPKPMATTRPRACERRPFRSARPVAGRGPVARSNSVCLAALTRCGGCEHGEKATLLLSSDDFVRLIPTWRSNRAPPCFSRPFLPFSVGPMRSSPPLSAVQPPCTRSPSPVTVPLRIHHLRSASRPILDTYAIRG